MHQQGAPAPGISDGNIVLGQDAHSVRVIQSLQYGMPVAARAVNRNHHPLVKQRRQDDATGQFRGGINVRCLRQRAVLDAAVIRVQVKHAFLARRGSGKTVFSRPPTPEQFSGRSEFQDGVQTGAGDKIAARGDVNRNVMACPAPTSSRAQAKVTEIAQQIAMHLAPHSHAYHEIWIDGEKVETVGETEEVEPIYGPTYLPRKFKIGIAFPGDNCIDVYTQDIGLVAFLEGAELAGFTVIIGGGMGMTHGKQETYPRLATPLCDISVEQALPVVEAIVTVQRDYGDRQNRKHARMKYVVEERGIDWFRAEVEQRLGYALRDPRPIVFHDVEDHLGWHRQGDGRWFLGLWIENGRVADSTSRSLRSGLRAVIEQFRPGIRLTAQQNILLTDITDARRAPLEALLHAHGIATDPRAAGVSRFAMACPSLPTCSLALAEAERALPAIMQQIEADLVALGLADESLSVRMTGCPNGGARPFMGDIGFVGRTKDVYHVYVGGDWANTRMNTLYAPSVRRENLAATVRPLFVLWRDERLPGETFGDFCQRLEPLFSTAYGAYLRLAAVARGHLRRYGLSYAQRDTFFGDFFNSEILDLLSYHVEIAPETLASELEESGAGRW